MCSKTNSPGTSRVSARVHRLVLAIGRANLAVVSLLAASVAVACQPGEASGTAPLPPAASTAYPGVRAIFPPHRQTEIARETETLAALLPPPRQTYDAGQARTRAALLLTQPPAVLTSTMPPRPTLTPEPYVFPTGIMTQPVAPPVAGMSFTLANVWAGIVKGEYVLVYAGAWRDNPGVTMEASQGTLIVAVNSSDRYRGTITDYDAPLANTGVLTITAESGLRLTLQAASGPVFYFDVPARQYAQGPRETLSAPTVTPLPTGRPTAAAPPPPTAHAPTPAYPVPDLPTVNRRAASRAAPRERGLRNQTGTLKPHSWGAVL